MKIWKKRIVKRNEMPLNKNEKKLVKILWKFYCPLTNTIELPELDIDCNLIMNNIIVDGEVQMNSWICKDIQRCCTKAINNIFQSDCTAETIIQDGHHAKKIISGENNVKRENIDTSSNREESEPRSENSITWEDIPTTCERFIID